MATIKEIKAELDKQYVVYPLYALKADLEKLLKPVEDAKIGTFVSLKTKKWMVDNMIVEPPFIDPNADPGTQA